MIMAKFNPFHLKELTVREARHKRKKRNTRLNFHLYTVKESSFLCLYHEFKQFKYSIVSEKKIARKPPLYLNANFSRTPTANII